jgi:hypothetical protein
MPSLNFDMTPSITYLDIYYWTHSELPWTLHIVWKLVVKERYRGLELRKKAFADPWDLRFSQQWFWRMLHWNVMPCGLIEVCWCFEGIYCLHLQDRRVSWGWIKLYCCREKWAWGMVLSEWAGVRGKWKNLRPFLRFPVSIQLFPCLAYLVFYREDEGDVFFENAGELLPDYMVPHPQYSSKPMFIWNSLIILMCRTRRYICATSVYCIWREPS